MIGRPKSAHFADYQHHYDRARVRTIATLTKQTAYITQYCTGNTIGISIIRGWKKPSSLAKLVYRDEVKFFFISVNIKVQLQ